MFKRMLTAGVIVGLCLGLLQSVIAPVAQAAQSTRCAAPTEDEMIALVDQFNTAFEAHDVQALATLVSPDIVRDSPRGDHTGVEEMVASFETFFETFPDLSSTVNLVLVDGPQAVVHYTSTATQALPFADTEPSGEMVTWDGMYLITVECGKISQHISHLDQLSQRNQGNSIPATPVNSTESGTPDACPELPGDAAQALMDIWYHDVWTGNLDVLASITTADVYHHWAIGPDSSGQDEQRTHLQGTFALDMFAGLTSGYDAIVVDGEYIAVHWEQSSGDDTWSGLNIFRTECGLIAEVWSEMDLAGMPASDAEATPAG